MFLLCFLRDFLGSEDPKETKMLIANRLTGLKTSTTQSRRGDVHLGDEHQAISRSAGTTVGRHVGFSPGPKRHVGGGAGWRPVSAQL